MLDEYCRAVVVVAGVAKHDIRVLLPRQGTNYVRKHIVRQPALTIVVRLARPHPVTGSVRVTLCAGGALARVIPRRQQSAGRADRQVRLPLRAGTAVGVQ